MGFGIWMRRSGRRWNLPRRVKLRWENFTKMKDDVDDAYDIMIRHGTRPV